MKKKITTFLILVLVVLMAMCFYSCNKLALEQTGNISYDGSTIKWDKVTGAEEYKVVINDGEEKIVSSTSYSFSDKALESITVSITAIIGEKKIGDGETATKTFIKLASIDANNVVISSEGAVSWPAVEGATGYEVVINGNSVNVVSCLYDQAGVGTNSIQIRPTAEGAYSYRSDAKSFTKLQTPSTITFNDETSKLSWYGSIGASSYEVVIDGGDPIVSTTNSCDYNARNTSFNVKIKAIGNGTSVFTSAFSSEASFIFLSSATNLNLNNGIFTWDRVDGATSYNVKVNDKIYTVTNNSYSGLSEKVSYNLSVKPVAANMTNHFSSWSVVKEVYLLAKPVISWNSSISMDDGTARQAIIWDGVNRAHGYTVQVTAPGGIETKSEFGESVRGFTYAFPEAGSYTVEVKSNAGVEAGIYDSQYSNKIYVKRLAAPTAGSNFITSNDRDLHAGFTVNFVRVDGAKGYNVYKETQLLDASSVSISTNQAHVTNIIDTTVVDKQTFNYFIKSKGGYSETNGRIDVTLASIEGLQVPITVLPMPTGLDIEGFTMSWDMMTDSNGFVVCISGSFQNSVSNTKDLRSLESGEFVLKISSRGNGAGVLPSNYTAVKNIKRLDAPTDVHISTAESGEGQLAYTSVENATAYDVTINNDTTPIPASNFSNMYQYITTTGSVIHIVARANYWDDEDDKNTYYLSSPSSSTNQIVRLTPPTFPEIAFTNSQFIWNAPTNINLSAYTPQYIVYDAMNVVHNGTKNGTTMNIAGIDGGIQYTFKVKAIGDGYNFINSETSETKTIFKLKTPTVTVVNDQYSWSNVTNAVNYNLEIDGVKYTDVRHESGEIYTYKPVFTSVGSYTVTVTALGDSGITTIDSNQFTINQITRQLTTPEISYGYTENAYTETGNIYATVNTAVANANGYEYVISGTVHPSAELRYEHNPNNLGKHYVKVRALGGKFDNDNIYCVTSQYAGGNDGYSVTLLGAPNHNTLSTNTDGVISWGITENAIGYDLEVDGQVFHFSARDTQFEYVWEEKTQITIRIRATGNDNGTIITSAWTNTKILYR